MAQFRIIDFDNVRETFTGAASTTITKGGAAQNSRSLAGAGMTSGDTTWMAARAGAEVSVGIFTDNGATVAQTMVFYSTNGNAAVSFSLGAAGEIFVDTPARLFDHLNLVEETLASAATADLGSIQGKCVQLTGTTGITSFGTSKNKERLVRYTGGGLTITHGATLVCPGGVNLVLATDDIFNAVSDNTATPIWRILWRRPANGTFNGLTITSTTGTFTVTNGKTLSVSNTLTLAGTDGSTLNVGAGGTLGSAAFKATGASGNTVPLLDNGSNTWSGTTVFNGTLSYSAASGVQFLSATATTGTNAVYEKLTNTGGNAFFGLENSVPNALVSGANPYALCFLTESARDVSIATNNTFRWNVHSDGSFYYPSATGANKGVGTINAAAVYDDNTLLTCPALADEFIKTGQIDLEKWDAFVPDRVIPENRKLVPLMEKVRVKERGLIEIEGGFVQTVETKTVERQIIDHVPVWDEDGNGIDAIAQPQFIEAVQAPERIERREHKTARIFARMVADGFDPRDPVAYIKKLKADQALPGMPTQADWQHNAIGIGEMHSRLWLATEMLALVVINLHDRVTALEAR